MWNSQRTDHDLAVGTCVCTVATNTCVGDIDWDKAVRVASVGMPLGYEPEARSFAHFTEACSGRESGHILDGLL